MTHLIVLARKGSTVATHDGSIIPQCEIIDGKPNQDAVRVVFTPTIARAIASGDLYVFKEPVIETPNLAIEKPNVELTTSEGKQFFSTKNRK
jgi:hypothetical protein